MSTPPRRIVFSLLHAGYLRQYGGAIRELAARGHAVHLALTRLEKDAGDDRLVERLAAECPAVTWGVGPARGRRDPWRALAWLVRAYTDLARYMHPDYADAPALRERIALKIGNHVRTAKTIDPLTARACLALLALFTSTSGERPLRRALRALALLEQAIPTARPIDAFLREQRPDAVLVTPLVELGSTQVDFLRSAQRLGIRTGVCVASWDNLTGKGLIRIVPDRVLVWNDVQRREAVRMHGIPEERIVLTGAQRFDEWFERRPSTTAAEHAERVGLDPARPYVLYLCSSPFIAPDEVSFVLRWLERLRASADARLREAGVLVRPHPQNAAQWRDVDLSGAGNVAVWPRAGAQPDAGDARAGFFDSLAHATAVVGVNTSALIESAILGRSVFTVLDPQFERTQTGTLHFHYLLRENGGFLRVARGLDEHVRQLEAALAGGAEADAEGTRRFVASFVRPNGLERPATPLVADALEELAALPPPEPLTAPPAALALRALLGAAALVSGTLFAASALARRGAYHPRGRALGRWLLEQPASARLARRLDERRRVAGGRPDLPPRRDEPAKPPHELRRIATAAPAALRALEERLERLAAEGRALEAGAASGPLDEELLYRLPFLRHVRERYGIAVSASGPVPWWYRGLEADGGEPLDVAVAWAGFRAGADPIRVVLDRLRFELVAPAEPARRETSAVAFSDPRLEREAVRRTAAALAAEGPLVSLSAGDPFDLRELGALDVDASDAAAVADALARARVLVGEQGPLTRCAPLHGAPTVALHPVPEAALSADVDLAYRAARAVGVPLVLLDARALDAAAALAAGIRCPSGAPAPAR